MISKYVWPTHIPPSYSNPRTRYDLEAGLRYRSVGALRYPPSPLVVDLLVLDQVIDPETDTGHETTLSRV
jgi:hypothetical protein